jgi:hypothetical protein
MYRDVLELDHTLAFSPNLVVNVYNQTKKLFFINSEELIGNFQVPLTSLEEKPDKPYFFNLIKDGKVTGRILTKFFLKKNEGFNNDMSELQQMALDELKAEQTTKCTLKIAVLGARYLSSETKDPIIEFKLTNDDQIQTLEPHTELCVPNKDHISCNPNFMNTITFTDISLKKDLILWPFLQITLRDRSVFGTKTCFTTIPLINYSWEDENKNDAIKNKALAILNRNVGIKGVIQKQNAKEKSHLRDGSSVSASDTASRTASSGSRGSRLSQRDRDVRGDLKDKMDSIGEQSVESEESDESDKEEDIQLLKNPVNFLGCEGFFMFFLE